MVVVYEKYYIVIHTRSLSEKVEGNMCLYSAGDWNSEGCINPRAFGHALYSLLVFPDTIHQQEILVVLCVLR